MKNTPTLEGGQSDGAAKMLPKPNEKGSTAPTAEPTNDIHAGQPELITQRDHITDPSSVDIEALATDATPSSSLALDHGVDDGIEYDRLIASQVVSRGGTLDEAKKILEKLDCYGSRHEPGDSAKVESECLEFFRAVSERHFEI